MIQKVLSNGVQICKYLNNKQLECLRQKINQGMFLTTQHLEPDSEAEIGLNGHCLQPGRVYMMSGEEDTCGLVSCVRRELCGAGI